MELLNWIKVRVINQLYRLIYYPHVHKLMKKYNVCSDKDTINSLIDTHTSLSRFGDGELLWILGKSKISFEKNSEQLRNSLIRVLKSNNKNMEIGLPAIFYNGTRYSYKDKRYYKLFMAKYGKEILPYLNKNKKYYNANISRIYTSNRCNKNIASKLFFQLRKIWNNKNILIIEGRGTRLGVGNNLFSNASNIKRIECPIKNAFESYKIILKKSLGVLDKNRNYITLISLGPTATVLAYDLFKNGYKAIDIGHIDVEYVWFLMNVKKKVNIPDKYVNEVNNGGYITNIKDNKYMHEIVANI